MSSSCLHFGNSISFNCNNCCKMLGTSSSGNKYTSCSCSLKVRRCTSFFCHPSSRFSFAFALLLGTLTSAVLAAFGSLRPTFAFLSFFLNVNLCWWMCGIILCDYKRVILWFDLLERFVDWSCGNVILIQTQDILQFGWEMDRRSLKQNYNESLAISLLEILFSSCSLCVLHVLCVRGFVVEVLQGFRGLNP